MQVFATVRSAGRQRPAGCTASIAATDRRRDAALAAAGYVVIRITWLRLTREPYAVLAEVAGALARRAPH
jgi:very-short-patch-repair endonuclease